MAGGAKGEERDLVEGRKTTAGGREGTAARKRGSEKERKNDVH